MNHLLKSQMELSIEALTTSCNFTQGKDLDITETIFLHQVYAVQVEAVQVLNGLRKYRSESKRSGNQDFAKYLKFISIYISINLFRYIFKVCNYF